MRKEDPVANKNLYAEHENQDWSVRGVLNRTILRPFKMLAVEPILLLVTVYISIVYGLLYGCTSFLALLQAYWTHTSMKLSVFQAFPIIFSEIHHFNIAETGLIFIGVGIGTTIGSLINYWFTLEYPALIVKWRGFPPPEKRLYSGMIGAPTLVIGAFWMGWSGNYESVPWYVAGLSTIFVGMGISLIFMSFLVSCFFLESLFAVDTDVPLFFSELPCRYVFVSACLSIISILSVVNNVFYRMYSASAFAANTFLRSAVAAAFPLFTVQMFNAVCYSSFLVRVFTQRLVF